MKKITVDGKETKYVVYVPPMYDAGKATPTIVFLNGAGECGVDGLKHVAVGLGGAVMTNVAKWPFLIIFPQKQKVEDAWEDEERMVMDILDKTRKEYNVDGSRLYLTGLSQGGHGTWAIAARHPELFAAIAPVCGWGDKQIAEKLAKTPVLIFHGESDTVVSVNRSKEMVEYLTAAGNTPKLTIYPGVDHNSWHNAYREDALPGWFLEHHK